MSEGEFNRNEFEYIDQEAARWVVRMSEGLSFSEQLEFDEWVVSNELCQACLDAHLETKRNMRELAKSMLEDGIEIDPDLFSEGRAAKAKRLLAFPVSILAVAACVAFMFIGFQGGRQWLIEESDLYAASFQVDAFERIFLRDGSLIELKPGSTVEVDYTANQRNLFLKSGEVHFSVIKDPSRPFVVHAGNTAFKALGTAFNVRLSSEDVELLVTEGLVKIDTPYFAKKSDDATGQNDLIDELEAKQKATISLERTEVEPVIETVSEEMIDEVLIWKHEVLAFDATPLQKAVLEFNRRNRDQIEIVDRSLRKEEIDGTFRSDNLIGFVKLLEISGKIEVRHGERGKIFFHRR